MSEADVYGAYDHDYHYGNGSVYDDGYYTFYSYENYYTNYNFSVDYLNEDFFYYDFYEFERPVYLFLWEILVIITTLANVLVMMVLRRRSMRNATNAILMAIAASDSLTGLVTLPTYIYAYNHYENKHLKLTRNWCEAFMVSKLFLSKAFHTMSIWLTVCLGLQRYISVSWPFRAQSLFTTLRTILMIIAVAVLSPVLHIYHLTNAKAANFRCAWVLKTPCTGDCAYLWFTFLIMHCVPCVLLLVLTSLMVITLRHAEAKMHESHLISSQKKLQQRAAQSRRISIIVVIVVVVFLVPEIPYGIFLLTSVSLMHQEKKLMSLETNRAFHCAYELLLVLSFHANFWVYTIMNRKFRSGLLRSFDPCLIILFRCLRICGIQKEIIRRPSVSSSYLGRHDSDLATRSLSLSQHSTTNHSTLEMKTYRADSTSRRTDGSLKESPLVKRVT